MELTKKQKRILELLQNEEEIATTKIAFLISANLYQTEVYLEELLAHGLLEKNSKNNATYWKLKREESNGKKI